MRQTSWHPPLRDCPALEEASLPAASTDPGAHQTLRQDGSAGDGEAYYAYHLGRAVQQYHRRLFAKQQPDCAGQ